MIDENKLREYIENKIQKARKVREDSGNVNWHIGYETALAELDDMIETIIKDTWERN